MKSATYCCLSVDEVDDLVEQLIKTGCQYVPGNPTIVAIHLSIRGKSRSVVEWNKILFVRAKRHKAWIRRLRQNWDDNWRSYDESMSDACLLTSLQTVSGGHSLDLSKLKDLLIEWLGKRYEYYHLTFVCKSWDSEQYFFQDCSRLPLRSGGMKGKSNTRGASLSDKLAKVDSKSTDSKGLSPMIRDDDWER